jgi:hypothetical protein
MSWDNEVCIERGHRLDGRDRTSFILHSIQAGSRVYPASYVMGIMVSLLGVKRLGHEADHSLLFSVEVRNGGAIPLLPHAS